IWTQNKARVNRLGCAEPKPGNRRLKPMPAATQILDRNLHIKRIDTYVDPVMPRERAIITHGHADHARSGHGKVLATADTIAIMRARYGDDCAGAFQAVEYGEKVRIDEVTITL